jgi:hypothetical protein
LAWLKSTKMRRPRSSFHQSTVTASGIRRASSPGRDHGVADVEELVRRLDGAEHVDAAIAAGLQPRFEAGLAQHVAQHRGDGRGIREIGARLRVEVDAQFDGIVGVGGERGPRVEDDGVHLHRPDDGRGLVEDDLR